MDALETFETLKVAAAEASVIALNALRGVLESPESKDSDKIKAAQQIVIIFDRAVDYTQLKKEYEEMRGELDHISDESEYQPEI